MSGDEVPGFATGHIPVPCIITSPPRVSSRRFPLRTADLNYQFVSQDGRKLYYDDGHGRLR